MRQPETALFVSILLPENYLNELMTIPRMMQAMAVIFVSPDVPVANEYFFTRFHDSVVTFVGG
jgi:hypothetical protein